MKPGPAHAAAVVGDYVELDMRPTPALEILRRIVVDKSWVSGTAVAYEMAEMWLDRFVVRLRRLEAESVAMGRYCPIAFNSSSEDLIQGPSFVEGTESQSTVIAKQRRMAYSNYVDVLATLGHEEFEWVCRGMLAAMGVEGSVVSRRSADEGIDFYGRLPLRAELRRAVDLPSVYSQLTVWMVGQAKHFTKGQGATPDIRALVGSVRLAEARAFPRTSALPGLEIRACEPVFYLFFTTGKISRDGWQLMSASGVVGMDGEMVANFLADHGIGWDGDGLDIEKFSEWVVMNAV